MRREDLFGKIFELEFCEPAQKAERERELQAQWAAACQETKTPLYVLEPAILKLYPYYRSQRLAKELPDIPFQVRRQ